MGSAEEKRARGCLLGLACGDALGAPFENSSALREPPKDFLPFGGLPAGSYTDDTQLAIMTAESILEKGGFDPDDVVSRYAEAVDRIRGIGITTLTVLEGVRNGLPWKEAAREAHEKTGGLSAGNGAVMRAAPVAIRYWNDLTALHQASVFQAAIIHHDPLAHEAAWLFNRILAAFIAGAEDTDGVLSEVEVEMLEKHPRMAALLREAVTCRRKDLPPPDGFVVNTLVNALWSFIETESAEAAISLAVSLGGDADTIGAVTGALAGAFYGENSLPERWLSRLEDSAKIRELALRLYRAAGVQ
jgi:ADP-ribosyl-[dinitrogen reductase] hydrolase